MAKNKEVEKDYMSIGEVAKKMNVTVRTLQYYDREGVLSPTSLSDGGRRLYNDKDIVKLHQILSLKSLGFSLKAIKTKLMKIDTTKDVISALTQQSQLIQSQIQSLTRVFNDIEMLKREVMQMQEVDFEKYADIIVNLQMRNEDYWVIKYFDDSTLDYLHSHFDKDSGMNMLNTISSIFDKAATFYNNNVSPDSEEGISLAEEFWEMLMNFTGGDMSMLPKLMKINENTAGNEKWQAKQVIINAFLEPALGCYFERMGHSPFEVKSE